MAKIQHDVCIKEVCLLCQVIEVRERMGVGEGVSAGAALINLSIWSQSLGVSHTVPIL